MVPCAPTEAKMVSEVEEGFEIRRLFFSLVLVGYRQGKDQWVKSTMRKNTWVSQYCLLFMGCYLALTMGAGVEEKVDGAMPVTTLSPPEGNTTFLDGTTWCVALAGVSQGSSNGSLCASRGKDGVILLWDLTEGKRLYSLDAGVIMHTLCFSPNKYWLCAATEQSIKIWDLESKSIVEDLKTEADKTKETGTANKKKVQRAPAPPKESRPIKDHVIKSRKGWKKMKLAMEGSSAENGSASAGLNTAFYSK
ncbi:hypothetical protein ACLB2K_056806 [Fragaria x ananassa]